MRHRLPILIAVCMAAVCVSVSAQKAERFPEFAGTVIPIDLPFQPEYRPYRSTETIRMDMRLKIANDNANLKLDTKVEQKVEQRGGKLEWSADIREMTMFGKKMRSRSPLMAARWVSGPDGTVEGFEVAYPGFSEQGITDLPPAPKKGTPEYDALVRQFGGGRRLPAEPITTGSMLFKQPLRDLFGELPGLTGAALKHEVGYVVRGWGFYRDKKVVVATQAFDAPIPYEGSGSISASLGGYTLFDATTFARLRSDFLVILSGQTDGKPVYFRIHGSSEAKVE